MVTTLSQLVSMMERGTIPSWLRAEIMAKKETIAEILRNGGEFELKGPNGERVSIRATQQVAAA
jgi:hypothetical protein